MGSKNRRANYDRGIVCGEGSDEVGFLKYLRSVYSSDPTNPKITNGRGGSPKKVVESIRKLPQYGAYSSRAALFDDDKGAKLFNSALVEAKKAPSIKPIIAVPFFEYEMLKVHGATGGILKRAKADPVVAKEEFSRVCDGSITGGALSYDKAFPKTLLDTKRRSSQWLDEVISLFE